MLRPILRRAPLLRDHRDSSSQRHLLEACRAMAAPIVAMLAMVQPAVEAAPVISGLHDTGTNIPLESGGQDAFWMVEAAPADTDVTDTVSYAALIFSGPALQADPTTNTNVPSSILSGHSVTELDGGRWFGAQSNVAPALLPNFLAPSSPLLALAR